MKKYHFRIVYAHHRWVGDQKTTEFGKIDVVFPKRYPTTAEVDNEIKGNKYFISLTYFGKSRE